MKVLITGACGLIGRVLIKELERHGHELRLVDRQRPEEATVFVPGGRVLSPLVTEWPFHLADIMDADAMGRATDSMDAVVHLAAIPSGLAESGMDTFHFNACGTYSILDASRKVGVSRVIAASSINAFGTFYWRINPLPIKYTHFPLTETFKPEPQDPYSLSKLVNEETCAAFHRAYGIKTAALRFGGVWSEEVYDKTLETGLRPTQAWSDDLYTWVHIRDIATGIRQALEAPDLPGYGSYTLNAADTSCPEPTMEILERFRPDYVSLLNGPIQGRDALISTAKARAAFGYEPKYRLDQET
jgi:UDP-glucose 4-epimerase